MKAFLEPQRLTSGDVNEQGYALGWRVHPASTAIDANRPTLRHHHGGVSKGAMSWLVCYPEARLGIALNINALTDRFEHLMNEEPALTSIFFDLGRALPAKTNSQR